MPKCSLRSIRMVGQLPSQTQREQVPYIRLKRKRLGVRVKLLMEVPCTSRVDMASSDLRHLLTNRMGLRGGNLNIANVSDLLSDTTYETFATLD